MRCSYYIETGNYIWFIDATDVEEIDMNDVEKQN